MAGTPVLSMIIILPQVVKTHADTPELQGLALFTIGQCC